MMKKNADKQSQASSQTSQFTRNEMYVSVNEAAALLGVSTRSMYDYLEKGKLAGELIGGMIVVRKDQLRTYQRPIVGRPRQRTPIWRAPVAGNMPYLLQFTVQVREGKQDELIPRLQQMRLARSHTFPGTVARYIARSESDPKLVQIMLLWRTQTMPDEQQRAAALDALRVDLADLLDWGTACIFQGSVLLNT